MLYSSPVRGRWYAPSPRHLRSLLSAGRVILRVVVFLFVFFVLYLISYTRTQKSRAQSEKHCRRRGASSGQKTRGCIEDFCVSCVWCCSCCVCVCVTCFCAYIVVGWSTKELVHRYLYARHVCFKEESYTQSVSRRLAFTRYCHHRYCMVYGIKRGGRWRGVYCPMVVQ